MPVQIDRMETAVEIASSTATESRPATARVATPGEPAAAPAFRDAVMQVLVDEFAHFTRMRGH